MLFPRYGLESVVEVQEKRLYISVYVCQANPAEGKVKRSDTPLKFVSESEYFWQAENSADGFVRAVAGMKMENSKEKLLEQGVVSDTLLKR
jgi:hypothetical protein